MIERKITENYEEVLHKVKCISKNIGLFTFVSEENVQEYGDIKIYLFNLSRKNFYFLYCYFETLSIMIVVNGKNISLTAIGGGGNKGVKIEKDFEKNLIKYNLE